MKRATLLFLIFFAFGSAVSAESPAPPDVPSLLAEAERMWETRDEPGHADKAMALYQRVIEIDARNDTALWQLARSFRWRGDVATSENQKLADYKQMESWAKKAIEADPNSIGGHLMLGVAYGRIGETQGVMKSLSLISPIKGEMNAVLAKDPRNDVAHHVLGVLYRKVPRLMGGSMEKSIQELEEAIASNPNGTIHYLELAKSHLEKGNKPQAKDSLEKLLAVSNPSDRVQSKMDRVEAQKLLADLKSP